MPAGRSSRPEIVVGIYLVVGRGPARGDFRPRTEQALVLAGGLLAGAQLLVKFNTGVTVLLVGAVTSWFVGRRSWRSEALFLGSAAGAVLAGWLVTGNNPIDLVAYVVNSVEVASGCWRGTSRCPTSSTRGRRCVKRGPACSTSPFRGGGSGPWKRPGAAMRSGYGLTPATVAHLEGRTVHFFPFEASMAWAYLDMKWRPLPVHQAYSAYTSKLDRLNARFVAGPSAPERILIEDGAIDARNPDWESPSTILARCALPPGRHPPRWAVLARVENRCGAPVSLGVAEAAFGKTIVVPPAADRRDMVVMARVRGLDASPLYALRSALLKIPVVGITLDGNRRYRAVPGTASNGLIVRAPLDRVGPAEPLAVVPTSTIRVDHGREWGVGSRLRIEFVGVPIAP